MNKPSNAVFPWLVIVQFLMGVTLLIWSTWGYTQTPKCLYISSYHQGYPWSDGVERGLRETLDGHCELRQLDMDTKRNKSTEFKQAAAEKAKALIESWKPDVVITSDDNAAKYLIKPFYKDAQTPFVFCGVNWTVKEYGFPYSNVTGIVEVAPVKPLLKTASELTQNGHRGLYLGADTLTEKKNYARSRDAAKALGLELDLKLVSATDEWIDAYTNSGTYDFLMIGSHSGINNWAPKKVSAALANNTAPLSVTVHDWMMPFSMLGYTKIPAEQGEWSGKSAIAILSGIAPNEIPIVSNRKWDIWANAQLLKVSNIELPEKLGKRAKKSELP